MKKILFILLCIICTSKLSIAAKQSESIEQLLKNNSISIELFFKINGKESYAGLIGYSNGKWNASYDADYRALKFLDAIISEDVLYISYLYVLYQVKGEPSYIDYDYPGRYTLTITKEQLAAYVANIKKEKSMKIQVEFKKFSKSSVKGIVITNNLRVRSKPSIQSTAQIINKLVKFDEVLIIDATKNEVIDGLEAPWYKIQFDDGTIGWVFGGYVKIYLWEDEIEEIKKAFAADGSEYSKYDYPDYE